MKKYLVLYNSTGEALQEEINEAASRGYNVEKLSVGVGPSGMDHVYVIMAYEYGEV